MSNSLSAQFDRWSAKQDSQAVVDAPDCMLREAFMAGAAAVASNPLRMDLMRLWAAYIVSHKRLENESPEDHQARIMAATVKMEVGIQSAAASVERAKTRRVPVYDRHPHNPEQNT